MFRTLRNRLLISHILPLLVIIPLTGLVLIYLLETQILLPQIMNTLAGDARVIYGQLLQLRFLIAGILLISLIAGAGLGLGLALNISSPIQKVTRAVYELSYGNEGQLAVEDGPDEIRMLSKAVNYLPTRLHNLEKYRQQLLANLVHELGRSSGALEVATLALLRGAERDPRLTHELLSGMEVEIQGLHRFLDDLQQMREHILGTLKLSSQPLRIGEWLPQILAPWQQSAKEKGLNFQIGFPVNLPEIDADPIRLAQALGNLLSNAIKYTPGGGKVMVSAGVEGTELFIRVIDTDLGISQDEQSDIFKPFFRGNLGAPGF